MSREIDQLKMEREKILVNLKDLNLSVKDLNQAVRLGWKPSYWFSSERSAKVRQLDDQRKSIDLLTRRRDDLQQRIQSETEQFTNQHVELDRYRAFDRLEAEATVKSLNSHLVQLQTELAQADVKKRRADDQLHEPLEALLEAQRQKSEIETEIARAATFDKRLNNAPNSFERKRVHDECNNHFGEGSPRKVIGAREKELEGVYRTIKKLEVRAQSIIDRLTRVIKLLVIDGNNLCYQQETFIGLSALRAVVQKISVDFPVIIVFDATIRHHLHMRDQEIAAQFGDVVQVHVVASKQSADETLLETASNPDAYIISNDRFTDFPDKSAVRERRIFRHEILNGRVFVHDLSLAEDWT